MTDAPNCSDELGTVVLASELYEFPHWNDTAVCTECEAEIDVPDMGDVNADMKEPFWRSEAHYSPCEDEYHALCESCYASEVSQIISEGEA